MALTVIESAETGFGYVPVLLGQASERVSNQEAANEMSSRGFRRGIPVREEPPVSPVAPPVKVATLSKADAIKEAVDSSLQQFGQAKKCRKPGGCPLDTKLFDKIAARSALLATRVLARGAITPRAAAVTPVSPSVSPTPSQVITRQKVRRPTRRTTPACPTPRRRTVRRLRGTAEDYMALSGFGQYNQVAEPTMTRWDWISVIANAASGAASTLDAYAQARADRERAGETARLTAAQMRGMITQVLAENPGLNPKDVKAAAAGASGETEPGMPGWVLPVVGGLGILVFVSMTRR